MKACCVLDNEVLADLENCGLLTIVYVIFVNLGLCKRQLCWWQ
jgi:hypothetical protein